MISVIYVICWLEVDGLVWWVLYFIDGWIILV